MLTVEEFAQRTVILDGEKYVLQMPSASWYMDYVDSCKDENGNLKTGAYVNGLLEAVVVEPRGLTVDSFTGNIRHMRKLSNAVESFIMGDEIKEDESRKNEQKPSTKKNTTKSE